MRFFGLLDGKAGASGAYGISFPDCPGCAAMGATENEVIANAIEALAEWLDDAGGHAPQPSNVIRLRAMPDVAEMLIQGGCLIQIPVLLEKARSVKANISLSQGLLEAIDEAAERLALTRSAFIAAAVREKISASY